MESLLIVTPDPDRADEIIRSLENHYTVSTLPSLESLHSVPHKPCALLLESDAPDAYHADLALRAFNKSGVPVILLTTPENGKGIGEIMDRANVFGCIVKAGAYGQILLHSIKRAVAESREKQRMRQALITLKERVTELETRLVETGGKDTATRGSASEKQVDILQEIVFVFKRGEIDLPSHPKMSQKFTELVENGATLQEIADLLKQDVALSSKLISISNSAYYRAMTTNKTLEQAINRLGLNTTKQYVDVIMHRGLFTSKNRNLLAIIETLWEHSLACAYASQGISETLNLPLAEDPFTLGLFHDIGKLVLLQTIGELQKKNKLGQNIDRAEILNTLETYHGKFGASLLKLWKFSNAYTQIAAHHDSLETADPITKALLIVHAANLLSKSMGYRLGEEAEMDVAGAESARLLGLKAEAIREIGDRVRTQMERFKEYFA